MPAFLLLPRGRIAGSHSTSQTRRISIMIRATAGTAGGLANALPTIRQDHRTSGLRDFLAAGSRQAGQS
jgi:hypothetical protein